MARKSIYVLLVILTLAPIPSASAANSNPGIIPRQAKYRGLGYSELQAKWWQTAFGIPVVDGEHPLING